MGTYKILFVTLMCPSTELTWVTTRSRVILDFSLFRIVKKFAISKQEKLSDYPRVVIQADSAFGQMNVTNKTLYHSCNSSQLSIWADKCHYYLLLQTLGSIWLMPCIKVNITVQKNMNQILMPSLKELGNMVWIKWWLQAEVWTMPTKLSKLPDRTVLFIRYLDSYEKQKNCTARFSCGHLLLIVIKAYSV